MASNDLERRISQVRPSVLLLLLSVGSWKSEGNSLFLGIM